ncbi:hypothetical protein ABS71_12090 [bacterium SCN 62-11]|nr:MAG: hypothetical protein ABS71_12090 [bacterium SCN 62-11]
MVVLAGLDVGLSGTAWVRLSPLQNPQLQLGPGLPQPSRGTLENRMKLLLSGIIHQVEGGLRRQLGAQQKLDPAGQTGPTTGKQSDNRQASCHGRRRKTLLNPPHIKSLFRLITEDTSSARVTSRRHDLPTG